MGYRLRRSHDGTRPDRQPFVPRTSPEAARGQLLAALLFEVEPLDRGVFALVGAVLLVVATVAALVPARRASRAQPVEVLRSE